MQSNVNANIVDNNKTTLINILLALFGFLVISRCGSNYTAYTEICIYCNCLVDIQAFCTQLKLIETIEIFHIIPMNFVRQKVFLFSSHLQWI